MSMNISLTPELQKIVQAQVDSGLYSSVSEVVRNAIRSTYIEKEDFGDILMKTVFKNTIERCEKGELELSSDWDSLDKEINAILDGET